MDDDTFDPRSWGRPKNPPQSGPPENKSANDSKKVEKVAYEDVEALPEAWRGIETEYGGQQPVASAPAEPAIQPAKRSNLAPLLISFLLLIGGAAAAWMTRIAAPPPVQRTEILAAPSPKAIPGIEQRSLTLASTADIVDALTLAGVPAADAQAAAQAAAQVLKAPGEIHAVIEIMQSGSAGGGYSLQRFQASYPDGSGGVVTRDAAGQYNGTVVAAELTKEIKVLRGELDTNSFYSSAVAAGLVDTLIPEFINAFGYDFNLASEVAPGDTFEVAYEQSVDTKGDAVGQPKLLFGSLTTKTKSLALYRFQPPGGEVGWYDGNGASTKRGLMRTPVDGARITSNFGMRFHPVLHYNKMHKGTDFAAPTGTPIYAAADGEVQWAAMKGANGNLTVLVHDKGMLTLYLHQSMFMPGIVAGAHVIQGQKIGEIGTTGRSTGPHLHFEVHIGGEAVDPLSIPADESKRKKIEGPGMQIFIAQRNRVDVARAQQAGKL